jgi:hypothetical protein
LACIQTTRNARIRWTTADEGIDPSDVDENFFRRHIENMRQDRSARLAIEPIPNDRRGCNPASPAR